MAAGNKFFFPDLPGHGKEWRAFRGLVTLGAMVKTVTELLDSADEPAVIVVHSRSGIVASRAAELRPNKVRKLIYLASFMLRDGERAADYFFNDADSLLRGNVTIDRFRMTDMIRKSVYKDGLYADCSADDLALSYALLGPEPSLPALTRLKLSERNYGSIPRYFIELTQDRAVSLTLQRKLVARSPCAQVFSLEASHSAYFSMPNELTSTILQIIHLPPAAG